MFDVGALAQFAAAYPNSPIVLHHTADQHPLFSLPRLTVLAGQIPRHSLSIQDDEETSQIDPATPAALLVQALPGRRGAIYVQDIDQDPDYRAWLKEVFRTFLPLLKGMTGHSPRTRGDIVLSSPGASTAWPPDVPSIWLQCRGTATATIDQDAFPLGEGDALFVPQNSKLSVLQDDNLGIAVVINWNENAPATQNKKGGLAALLARLFGRQL